MKDLTDTTTEWGDGLIEMSNAYEQHGLDVARSAAERFIDTVYAYDLSPVLFKPTLASGEYTFRPTRKGALSYFIGHDPDFPLDRGFALMGWRHVSSETSHQLINESIALWMGWMTMTDKDGNVTKVDKTFGYTRDVDGRLRIVLHHSSLPYQPDLPEPIP